MCRLLNVATRGVPVAVADRVPDRVPLEGLLAIRTNTVGWLPPETGFPKLSVTATRTAGVIAAVAAALDGWTLNFRRARGPNVTVMVGCWLIATPFTGAGRKSGGEGNR